MTEEKLLAYRIDAFVRRFARWKRLFQGDTYYEDHAVSMIPSVPDDLFKLPEPTAVIEIPPSAIHDVLLSIGLAEPYPEFPPRFERFEIPTPPEAMPIDAVELQLQFPRDADIAREQWEKVLWDLAECGPVSFEIVAAQSRIVFQFVCDERMRRAARSIIAEQFPDILIREERGYLAKHFSEAIARHPATDAMHEYGLSEECILPLPAWQPHEPDPLEPIADALRALRHDECGSYQIWFAPVAPAVRSGLESLIRNDPAPFAKLFPDCAIGPAKQKLSRPLLTARVRIMFCTQSAEQTRNLFLALDMCFQGWRRQGGNTLSRGRHPNKEHGIVFGRQSDRINAVQRLSHRSGMILSRDEVFALAHLPLSRAADSRLRIIQPKTKAAGANCLVPRSGDFGDGVLLGINEHQDNKTGVVVHAESRSRHTYVIGVSGTGKSSLLLGMLLQDIASGGGVAVLDPHGDLIEKVLEYVPEKRSGDVLLFDPADEAYPVGFNILAAHSDAEKNLLASDLVAVFRRLSTAWGDQMNSVLANAILAFLESPRGGTLVDLRNFLVDKEYRRTFLETVNDDGVRYYWTKEFPLLSGRPQGPILTRLDAFLRPKMIRNMVSQKDNKLDFAALMNQKKIVLAKLTHGAIGEENASLLGSLLVSGFHQAAIGRQSMPQAQRSLFNLYIDEFHNFVTPSIASILSGGRKYGLGLTLAHQELRQLWSRDEQVASAVLSNPATRICFRTGEWDAQKLAEGFSFFTAKDIQSLPRGQAICRIDTADNDFNLATIPWEHLIGEPQDKDERKEKVRALSRERYATPLGALAAADAPPPDMAIAEEPPSSPHRAEKSIPRAEAVPAPHHREVEPAQAVSRERSTGRGGERHKYLQHLFKSSAEEFGYRADIEFAVLDGAGSVDLALEKNGTRIACEISITTDAAHEVGNIEKCLAAGFEKVVLISPERKTLQKIRALAEAKWKNELARIVFVSPEEFVALLEAEDADAAGGEETVKGYKVKTNFRPLDGHEKEARKKTIAQTILKALKRMKGG